MKTILQIGPLDHGKCFSEEELESAEYEPGCIYEIIEGALYVSPAPNLSHDFIRNKLYCLLCEHLAKHPNAFAYISQHARVHVPAKPQITAPEPDLALYRIAPTGRSGADWRDFSPFIVAEILSPGNEDKDLVRNVDLYLQVPSILEYWVFDITVNAAAGLIIYRRVNDAWQKAMITAEHFQTDLLPGFNLPTRRELFTTP